MITLVLNSPCIDLELLRKLAQNSVLVGVDGGLNHIDQAGLQPHWALGDFDSVAPGLLQDLPQRTKILRFPVEKDYTDLEFALKLVQLHRPKRIDILGLLGGERFDHQLVNCLMLSKLAQSGCIIRAWGGPQHLIFTAQGFLLPRKIWRKFSVFALTAPAMIRIAGAKYDGAKLDLQPGSGLGLGNAIVAQRAMVNVLHGVVGISAWK